MIATSSQSTAPRTASNPFERHYDIEGLRSDYYSLLSTLRETKNKKERKIVAGWISKIKEILNELGEKTNKTSDD